MCSIFGSFDKGRLVELANLNAYRGQHSHSVSFYSMATQQIVSVHRGLGPLDANTISIPPNYYCICHMQAPTTEAKTIDSVHPAQDLDDYLWHNGILKKSTIEYLREEYCKSDMNLPDTEWDTKLLLYHFNHFGNLSKIDGTFSCLAALKVNNVHELFLFRNELAPMFKDDKYNISSTMFPGSIATPPNVVFAFEPGVSFRTTGESFITAENPYYFN